MTPEKIQKVVTLFTNEAQKIYGSCLQSVILYGSCARGDYTADSDIDILVLLDIPQNRISAERKRILEITDQLDLEYDVVLTPVLQSQQTFDRYLQVSGYYQNVRAEGVYYA